MSGLRGMLSVAHEEYELRIYGVRATLLSYVPCMCDVCKSYRTYLHIFKCTHKKCSTSAYEEYELCIEEYQLTYVQRTRDVPFVS